MTIAAAWVRTAGECRELVLASDSRLRSYGKWDGCPKLYPLLRGDAALCFAGDTHYAYPFMLQIDAWIRNYRQARERLMSLEDLKGHVIRMMNAMLSHRDEQELPEAALLLGGYCWRRKDFLLWTLHFDCSIGSFTFRSAHLWSGCGDSNRKIAWVGDETHVQVAKERMIELMRSRNSLDSGGFDMEPFEVIRDMLIAADDNESIGGPPQLLKIYQHCNTQVFGVYWPSLAEGSPTVLGRACLGYEHVDPPVLDPHALEWHNHQRVMRDSSGPSHRE